MGCETRARSLPGLGRELLGNSRHLWMWDEEGLRRKLLEHGFVDIRRAAFGDSEDPMFSLVEEKDSLPRRVRDGSQDARRPSGMSRGTLPHAGAKATAGRRAPSVGAAADRRARPPAAAREALPRRRPEAQPC